MGKGMACRECGHPMKVVEEVDEEKGTWVTYECQNHRCREHGQKIRQFEDSSKY